MTAPEREPLSEFADEFTALLEGNHQVANPRGWVAEVEARAIFAFVSYVSAEYKAHTGKAVREDMVLACARFGAEPAWFFTDEDDVVDAAGVRELRAEVAYYRVIEGLE